MKARYKYRIYPTVGQKQWQFYY
ncbi:helix-turn-helix domain-containing protein [Dapis sp. BLCC M172]